MRRALLAIIVLAACHDVPTVPPAPSSLVVASGDHQTGVPGYLLANQIAVRLLDENGNPAVGDTVVFSATDNTGVLGLWTESRDGERRATLSITRAVTDANGTASTQWRLGQTLGTQTVTVQVISVPEVAPATITSTSASNLVTSIQDSPAGICAINAQKQLGCWVPPRLDGPVVSTKFVPVASTAQFTEVVIPSFPGQTSPAQTGCALAASGRVWCFMLGAQAAVQQLAELPGSYPPLTSLSGEFGNAPSFCGLTADGQAWCWGSNDKGQLGDGTKTDRPSPTAVLTSARFVQIDLGGLHTCGLTAAGDAWCWGTNSLLESGQAPDEIFVTAPALVASPVKFTQVISTTNPLSCAESVDRALYCWGDIVYVEAGGGPTAVPVKIANTGPVVGLADVSDIVMTLTPAPSLVALYTRALPSANPGFRNLATGHGSRYVCGSAVTGSGTLCQYFFITDQGPFNWPQVIGVPLP